MVLILKTTFEDILPIWKNSLWAGRTGPIRANSSIPYLGGSYDMSIYSYPATFWKVVDNHKIIAVNSGFKTAEGYYRSRGIWVQEAYRNGQVSTLLFLEVDKQAQTENCHYIWSIPRKAALPAYLRAGFKQTSDFFSDNIEFGPNCYVLKEV